MRRLVLEETASGQVLTRVVYESGDREFTSLLDVRSMLNRARMDLPNSIAQLSIGRFPDRQDSKSKKEDA